MGRSARPAEPHIAGLDKLLFLWDAHAGLSRRGQLCLPASTRILAEAAQSAIARRASVFRRGCIRQAGRVAPAPGAAGAAACDSDEVKPAGEPDAGNPPVRIDERGRETEPRRGLRHWRKAKAAGNGNSLRLQPLRPSSTLPTWRAKARNRPATTSLLLVTVLNVLSSTPLHIQTSLGANLRAPRIDGPLTHFRSPRG